MPGEGFSTRLDALTHTATIVLPGLAAHLESAASVLDKPLSYDPVGTGNVHAAHTEMVDAIAHRHRLMVDGVLVTAKTLLEIVELYRRADGQVA